MNIYVYIHKRRTKIYVHIHTCLRTHTLHIHTYTHTSARTFAIPVRELVGIVVDELLVFFRIAQCGVDQLGQTCVSE